VSGISGRREAPLNFAGPWTRRKVARSAWEANYESASFSQEDLQELQDRAPPAHRVRHLLRPAPQAASRLMISCNFSVKCRVFPRGVTAR
jgi:hypothetical protein